MTKKKQSEKTMIVVSREDLSKVENNLLNTKQLNVLLMGTPAEAKYTRPAKGGGTWTYVTGTYVKKVLNMMFGWNWDFEVVKFEYNMQAKQCIVLGKLTVRTGDAVIIKNQFGRTDIKFKTENRMDEDGSWIMDERYPQSKKRFPTEEPLDLGNDLKGATTDALKKCASELGVASDVYGAEEFKKVKVVESEDMTPLEDEVILAVEQCTEKDQVLELANSFDKLKDNVHFQELIDEKLKELS